MPAEVFADLDAAISPISGSAPTTPVVGRAYRTLERAYADATGDEIANRAFAPNVWDAIYLAAAALTAQRVRGEDAGGPGLRTTLREVSRDGPILHAGQWIDLTTILRNGGDVDYDGASGPVDFKDDGEVDGPYEIWQVAPDGAGGFGFERAFYIDARNIPAVLETFGVKYRRTGDELRCGHCPGCGPRTRAAPASRSPCGTAGRRDGSRDPAAPRRFAARRPRGAAVQAQSTRARARRGGRTR